MPQNTQETLYHNEQLQYKYRKYSSRHRLLYCMAIEESIAKPLDDKISFHHLHDYITFMCDYCTHTAPLDTCTPTDTILSTFVLNSCINN